MGIEVLVQHGKSFGLKVMNASLGSGFDRIKKNIGVEICLVLISRKDYINFIHEKIDPSFLLCVNISACM